MNLLKRLAAVFAAIIVVASFTASADAVTLRIMDNSGTEKGFMVQIVPPAPAEITFHQHIAATPTTGEVIITLPDYPPGTCFITTAYNEAGQSVGSNRLCLEAPLTTKLSNAPNQTAVTK